MGDHFEDVKSGRAGSGVILRPGGTDVSLRDGGDNWDCDGGVGCGVGRAVCVLSVMRMR
jgi:hypothetical protein